MYDLFPPVGGHGPPENSQEVQKSKERCWASRPLPTGGQHTGNQYMPPVGGHARQHPPHHTPPKHHQRDHACAPRTGGGTCSRDLVGERGAEREVGKCRGEEEGGGGSCQPFFNLEGGEEGRRGAPLPFASGLEDCSKDCINECSKYCSRDCSNKLQQILQQRFHQQL